MRAPVVSLCLLLGLIACADSGGGGDDGVDRPDAREVSCGDGVCDTSELSSCAQDCGTPPPCNNNGVCNAGENASTCPSDCTQQVTCDNDGVCDAGETVTNCAADCTTGSVCNFNAVCDAGEVMGTCIDCGPPPGTCNMDLVCDAGEPADCIDCLFGTCNMDGVCDAGELPLICVDCPL